MSGGNQYWQAPQHIFDFFDREFKFQIDVAASKDNKKCPIYISEAGDAFQLGWFMRCRGEDPICRAWCNPPFKDPRPWIVRAYGETQQHPSNVCAMLLNCCPDTEWYGMALEYCTEIRILTGGRIQFDAPPGVKRSSNPKSQVLLVFRRKPRGMPCHVWHQELPKPPNKQEGATQ